MYEKRKIISKTINRYVEGNVKIMKRSTLLTGDRLD